MPENLKIVFCVPTFNRARVAVSTAEINAAICARHRNCTLAYLDNASEDDTFILLAKMLASHGTTSRLIRNDANIGLKGSLLRFFREFSAADTMLVFLSDEDIIYEPGLQALEEEIARDSSYITCNKHYCFNYLTRRGKDFLYRRRRRAPSTWSRWDPFTFGYISGFAATLEPSVAASISEAEMLDRRNVYPHWAAFTFDPTAVTIPGIALVAEFAVGNNSSFHKELIHQESHLSPRNVTAYCEFHATHTAGFHPWLWRLRYRFCNALMRGFASGRIGVGALLSAIVLCILWPRMLIYYLGRATT